MSECGCGCKLKYTLVFACSGAADVGAIADQAARRLASSKVGKMSCIAGISAHDADILQMTSGASSLIVIDGCDKDCAAKTLQTAGFHELSHTRVTSLGMEKGKTPVTDQNVAKVVEDATVRRPLQN